MYVAAFYSQHRVDLIISFLYEHLYLRGYKTSGYQVFIKPN